MRILIVGLNYAPEPTGIAPYATSLAEGLIQSGHEVRVITGYPHYPQWQTMEGYHGLRRRETIGSVPVTRVRHTVPRRPTSSLERVVSELSFGLHSALVPWHRPDVVITVSPALFACGVVSLRARAFTRAKLVIWVQDLYGMGMREAESNTSRTRSLSARAVSAVESIILSTADGVAVIHDRFLRSVTQLRVPAERVTVIRNWSHLANDEPSTDRAATRRRLGWAQDDIVVLHAGNMGAKQGLESVVDAGLLLEEAARHSELPDTSKRLRFVLMGHGNQRDTLRERAKGGQRIQFIDSLPDDEYLCALHAADVLLVNERQGVREMCVPSKLTSYYSSGRPVLVATNVGSVSAAEIQTSGGGVRTDPGDPVALIKAACALGADPELSAEVGARGKAFRTAHLTAESAIRQFNDFLSQLATDAGEESARGLRFGRPERNTRTGSAAGCKTSTRYRGNRA